MMKDFAFGNGLNSPYDLQIAEQDLVLCSDAVEFEQNLRAKLRFIYGEWFLDTTKGLKYFEHIWTKAPNLTLVDSLYRATISECEEVVSIVSFSSRLAARTRTFYLEFQAETIYGRINFKEEYTR